MFKIAENSSSAATDNSLQAGTAGWRGGGRQHPVQSFQATAHGKKANSFLPLYNYEAILNIWVGVISDPGMKFATTFSSDPKE